MGFTAFGTAFADRCLQLLNDCPTRGRRRPRSEGASSRAPPYVTVFFSCRRAAELLSGGKQKVAALYSGKSRQAEAKEKKNSHEKKPLNAGTVKTNFRHNRTIKTQQKEGPRRDADHRVPLREAGRKRCPPSSPNTVASILDRVQEFRTAKAHARKTIGHARKTRLGEGPPAESEKAEGKIGRAPGMIIRRPQDPQPALKGADAEDKTPQGKM